MAKYVRITEEAWKTLVDIIKGIRSQANSLKSKLDNYPDITAGMKTDGVAYALINGKFEGIASAGRNVVTYNPTTAATLQALDEGRIPVGLSEEELEKVKANIPEDIWEELGRQAVTLELTPTTEEPSTDEEKIAQAIEAYRMRKAEGEISDLMPGFGGVQIPLMPVKGEVTDVEPENIEEV